MHLINSYTGLIMKVMAGNYQVWSTMLSGISKDRSPNELFILVSILYYFHISLPIIYHGQQHAVM